MPRDIVHSIYLLNGTLIWIGVLRIKKYTSMLIAPKSLLSVASGYMTVSAIAIQAIT